MKAFLSQFNPKTDLERLAVLFVIALALLSVVWGRALPVSLDRSIINPLPAPSDPAPELVPLPKKTGSPDMPICMPDNPCYPELNLRTI